MEQKPMQVPPRIKPPPPPRPKPQIPANNQVVGVSSAQQVAKSDITPNNVPNSPNLNNQTNNLKPNAQNLANKTFVETNNQQAKIESQNVQNENASNLTDTFAEEQKEQTLNEENLQPALNEEDLQPALNEENLQLPENNQKSQSDSALNEKPIKVKKEKKPRKKISKKMLILIIGICFSFVMAVGCLSSVFILKELRVPKLSAPTIKVVQLFNGTVLQASSIEEAIAYEFEITNHANKTSTYRSSKNSLELRTYLNQGGEYSVRVRALGESKRATSEYSEKLSFTNYVQLKTPRIYVNNLTETETKNLYKSDETIAQTNDTITWESVDNADRYLVRYGVDLDNDSITSEEVLSVQGTVTFNLSKIYAKGTGVYQISIVAVPLEGSYFLQSDYEKIVTIEYYSKQTKVSGAKFNKTTKQLSFSLPYGSLYGNELELHISYISGKADSTHKIYLSECQTENIFGKLNVTLTLSQLNVSDIYAMAIITLSDGTFSTDSDPSLVTIN